MGLVLGLTLQEPDLFLADGHFRLIRVFGGGGILLGPEEVLYHLTDDPSCIWPFVWVKCRRKSGSEVKIIIDAGPDVLVVRGKLKRSGGW